MAVKRSSGHRERLLSGARSCLHERGYARTTARDLVAASGTNLGSIGYHFGSKEALLEEALVEGFREWTAEVERAAFAAPDAPPVERLERSLAAMIDRFAQLRPFLVAFVEAFPPAVRDEPLRARMAEAYAEARAAGAGMVRRAMDGDGMQGAGEHATVIASVVMAICDGLMLQWLLDPGAVPDARAVTEALASLGAALAAQRGT